MKLSQVPHMEIVAMAEAAVMVAAFCEPFLQSPANQPPALFA